MHLQALWPFHQVEHGAECWGTYKCPLYSGLDCTSFVCHFRQKDHECLHKTASASLCIILRGVSLKKHGVDYHKLPISKTLICRASEYWTKLSKWWFSLPSTGSSKKCCDLQYFSPSSSWTLKIDFLLLFSALFLQKLNYIVTTDLWVQGTTQ